MEKYSLSGYQLPSYQAKKQKQGHLLHFLIMVVRDGLRHRYGTFLITKVQAHMWNFLEGARRYC